MEEPSEVRGEIGSLQTGVPDRCEEPCVRQTKVRCKSRKGNTRLIAEPSLQPLTDFSFCNDLVPSFLLPPYGGWVGGGIQLLKLHKTGE